MSSPPEGASRDAAIARAKLAVEETSAEAADPAIARDYWRANLKLMAGCLVVWALVSFGFGILLRPLLSGISVGGTDLGFWFAQQGSIIVFIVIIFFYAIRMNSLDRKFGMEEE